MGSSSYKLLLLIATTGMTSCLLFKGKVETNPDSSLVLKEGNSIALLLPRVYIKDERVNVKLTAEKLKEEELNMATQFQTNSYEYLIKKKETGNIKINIQHPDSTSAIFKRYGSDNPISHADEVAILGVNAVMTSVYRIEIKPAYINSHLMLEPPSTMVKVTYILYDKYGKELWSYADKKVASVVLEANMKAKQEELMRSLFEDAVKTIPFPK